MTRIKDIQRELDRLRTEAQTIRELPNVGPDEKISLLFELVTTTLALQAEMVAALRLDQGLEE